MTTIDTTTPGAHSDEFCDWLREHGIEPNLTFRVDVGQDTVEVHQYKLNEYGRKHVDETGEVALCDPFSIPLRREIPGVVAQDPGGNAE